MGDNGASHGRFRQLRVETFGELEQEVGVHSATPDVGNLFDFDRRDGLQLWQIVDKLLRRDATITVFGKFPSMRTFGLDGSAGGEKFDRGQAAVCSTVYGGSKEADETAEAA